MCVDVRIGRAHLLAEQGKLEEALDDFNKALELAPKNAHNYNNIAWALVTCADTSFWDPARAVELATTAVELSPEHVEYLNTLGVSHYRDGDYSAAVKNLAKSVELDRNGTAVAHNGLFLAMAHAQLGDHDEAGRWFDKAVQWMAEHESTDAELVRFKREAEQLLGLSESDQD